MPQQILELTGDDTTRLSDQFALVHQLALSTLGRGLAQDESDLGVLQALLDAGALTREQTYELQSMGVVFGFRLLSALEGLDWAIVEDEYGRDPALRYLDTSILLFPLTMISKRVEAGTDVDVAGLFRTICDGFDDVRRRMGVSVS
ncbi:MAG: DUF3806 domain-containing protein [Kofleriaceae bacterium]|nr:DUF3806 domain-containing protein [Kofleriaceae bacterium]